MSERQFAAAGALHRTMEEAATGYDPSIGRTPVEQGNNGSYNVLTNASFTAIIKSAPGFMRGVTITTHGTLSATHLVIYDNTAASGTVILDVIKLPPTTETKWIDEDTLFVTGLSVALCTVNATTGAVTNAAAGASGCVSVGISYR